MAYVFLTLCLISLTFVTLCEGCEDKSQHCSKWQKEGFCDPNSSYYAYMKDTCAKTCGTCRPLDVDCEDDMETCKSWAEAGYCAKDSPYHGWMAESCRLSCGFCKKEPTKTPPATTRPPTPPPTTVKTDETVSVTERPLPDNCRDKSSYCASYKPYCHDKDYVDYLQTECKRTCRFCWLTTRPPPTTLYVSTQPYTGAGGRKIQPNCGNKEKSKQRIVGGKNALPGSWPWQVSMDWKYNEANPGHMCGGTLITDQWVMSAAHCFKNDGNKDNYWLTLGQHNIKQVSGREQVFNISELYTHPLYNTETQDYDLALIKLSSKAHLNDYVRTACLPGQNTSFPTGQKCYITGWGLLSEYGKGPAILQQAQVPLVSRGVCKKAYGALDYSISPRMLCAGYEKGGIDACEGDSGGPLVCNEVDDKGKDIWYVWGAISWGVGCARKGMYGVLANTKVLRPWIDQVVFNGHVG